MPTAFSVAKTVDEVIATCDHDHPLESDDPRYEDLSAGRGDNTLRSLKRLIINRAPETFVHAALLSHRGVGKTTELKRLMVELKHNFDCFYIEANLQLDPRHVTSEDLLLTLALGVQEHFDETNRPLPGTKIAKVQAWFSDVVKTTDWAKKLSAELATTAGGGIDVPLIVTLKAELKALLRTESEYREQVRDAFRRQPNALLDAVNGVMGAAEQALSAEGEGRQLLVLIDNLDRYDPEVVDELLIRRGLLRDVRCHMLVTPPISLHYKPVGAPLSSAYKCEVMNTVRLRDPDQDYGEFSADRRGYDLMVKALAKRIDMEKLLPDPLARERLVSASGGAIRNLLRLTQEAALVASNTTLDLSNINTAARRLRSEMRDRINTNGWVDTLAKIAFTKRPHEGPGCMTVLFHQLALKYNGDDWYDIHPLVAEIPEVKTAMLALRDAAAKQQTGTDVGPSGARS